MDVFGLLNDAGKEDAILAKGRCMLDHWSRDILYNHPEHPVGGKVFKAKLAAIAESVLAIPAVEMQHGRVRRTILRQESHTWQPTFDYVDAQTIGNEFRRHKVELLSMMGEGCSCC